jgi:hypothetical protein
MPKRKKDSVDAMIEGWASSLTSGTRVSSEGSNDLADFTLTPKPNAPVDVDYLSAAQAVAAALRANTGRRKNYKHWVPVARDHLGAKRLSAKRYDEVLEAGYAAGLFKLDSDTLSFPILVALEPEPVPEPDPDFEGGGDPGVKRAPAVVPPPPPPIDPETWDPITYLDCGHWNRQKVPDPEASEGKEDGKMAVAATKIVRVEKPGKANCPACKAGTPGAYQYQRGRYRQPIPESKRRDKAKSEPGYPGYPGLCTDPKTGFYIGGLGNDCRRYHKGPERCVVHAESKSEKKTKKTKKSNPKRKSPSDRRNRKSA